MPNKRINISLVILIFISNIICFAQTDSTASVSMTTIVKQQADSMGYYFVKNDFKNYLKFQFPNLVKKLGGEESLMKTLNENVTKKGIRALNISTDAPSALIISDSTLQCTLQQTSVMKYGSAKLEIISTLVCVSYDNGKKWFFINASGFTSDILKEILPEISRDLMIQQQTTRKLN